ncbi:MAG: hypothetical protein AAGB26_01130 [Planctomycetota bacterium]
MSQRNLVWLIVLYLVMVPGPLQAQVQTEDPVADRLEKARQQHADSVEEARSRLADDIEKVLERVSTNSGAPVDERLEEIKTLKKIRATFVDEGIVLDHSRLRLHIKRYQRQIDSAHNRMVVAFKDAAKAYGRINNLELAEAVLQELEAFRSEWEKNAEVESVTGASSFLRFANQVKAYNNRNYVFIDIPEDLPLGRFAQIAGGGEDPLTIKVAKGGWLYIAVRDKKHPGNVAPAYLKKEEWEATDWTFAYSDPNKTRLRIYRKHVASGTLKIPRLNWPGPFVLVE